MLSPNWWVFLRLDSTKMGTNLTTPNARKIDFRQFRTHCHQLASSVKRGFSPNPREFHGISHASHAACCGLLAEQGMVRAASGEVLIPLPAFKGGSGFKAFRHAMSLKQKKRVRGHTVNPLRPEPRETPR